MKILLLRGPPGIGKTTLAHSLNCSFYAIDDYTNRLTCADCDEEEKWKKDHSSGVIGKR